jgi:hypothetical protein
VLSKAGSESARRSIAKPAESRRIRSPAPAPARPSRPGELAEGAEPAAPAESASPDPGSPDPGSGNGSPTTAAAQARGKLARRTRKTKDGLPEGWVIDEEGYVVPRHG